MPSGKGDDLMGIDLLGELDKEALQSTPVKKKTDPETPAESKKKAKSGEKRVKKKTLTFLRSKPNVLDVSWSLPRRRVTQCDGINNGNSFPS